MIYICEASEVWFFGEAEEDRHRFKYVVILEAFVCDGEIDFSTHCPELQSLITWVSNLMPACVIAVLLGSDHNSRDNLLHQCVA